MSDEGGTGDEERSQWRIAPSDPPETRTGWNGCHVTATELEKLNFESNFDQGAERYTKRTANFFFVASECLDLPHGSDIEDADGLVSRSTSDHVSVRRPR